jgi:membrane-associated phospholipid phosphatase
MKIFYSALAYLGFWGPMILLLLTIGILSRGPFRLFGAYILGQICNSLSNYILKDLIRQPRPSKDNVHYFTWNSLEDHYHVAKTMGSQEYGMPSGHAQSVIFSLVFVQYALHNPWLTFLYGCFSVITLVQRIVYENHSVEQVVVGSIIGGILGYLSWIHLPHYVGKLERHFTEQQV